MGQLFYFAANYDCGAYGGGTYDNGTTCSASVVTTTTGGNGVLTNTGLDIAIIITAACILAFLAMLVRFWRRPSTPKNPSS